MRRFRKHTDNSRPSDAEPDLQQAIIEAAIKAAEQRRQSEQDEAEFNATIHAAAEVTGLSEAEIRRIAERIRTQRQQRQQNPQQASMQPQRYRAVAILLAFFFGWCGLQRFYLGQYGRGIVSMVFFWTLIPWLLGLIQMVRLLAMSDYAFAYRYGVIPESNQSHVKPDSTVVRPEHDRILVGVLALILGSFGIHKFYLGHIGLGLVYLVFSFTGIPAIIGFIEGVLYLCESDTRFQRRYA